MAKLLLFFGNHKKFPAYFARKTGLIVFLATSSIVSVFAQQIEIKGKILEESSNVSVIGATIKVKGQKDGTVSDVNGDFHLKIKTLPATLVISNVGSKNQEIDVYEATEPLTVYLAEDQNKLNEVVVVGYQQTKKNALASATTTVSAGDLAKANYTTISEKLQGQVPGLLVSNSSGVPGTQVLVRLRGATSINAGNDPLYVVDGVFINSESLQSHGLGGQVSNPLSDLSTDDIESVSVLKDANATAMYGSRGANGVILITTKRGARNGKTKVQFQAEYGVAKTGDLWTLTTGPEHAQIVNDCWINDGKTYATRPFRPTTEVITGYAAYGNPEDQKTYNRLDDVFRTAQLQKYNLSVSGGDAKTNFYLGGEYQKQQATLKLENFERYSFQINLDHSISKQVKVGTSNSLSKVNRQVVQVGDGPAGFFQAALHTPTFYPIYNADGTYNKPVAFDNPEAILDNSDDHSYSLRSVNNVYLKWDILKGLSFKSSWSNDYNNYHEKTYWNTFLINGQPNGQATDITTSKQTLIEEQVLNYNLSLAKESDLSFFLGNSAQTTNIERESLTGTVFPSNQFKRITSAAVQTASSTGTSSALISYFAGGNFSYHNRYSIDANIRYDGSSRIGKNKQWGYFPSVGAAWNISNESFIPKTQVVTNLKLKASLGYSGNQNISDFASLGLWSGGSNYDGVAGISPSQLGNPNLKWETTRQWNVGLTGDLLKERLSFDINYYDKYTSDLLLDDPVPAKTGYSSVTKNIGEISNRGIEVALNSVNIKNKRFEWKTNFSISHNANNVEKLNTPITSSYQTYQVQQGFPLYSMWVYHYLGVNPQTGDAIYEDLNNDGKITVADKKIVGNAWPKFEGSIKNTFSYKGFDLDINVYFKSGNKIYNYTSSFLESGGTRGVTRSILESSMNYWKKPGDTNVLPRPKSTVNADGGFNYDQQSSRYVEDGSYLRLRDITFGYSFSKRALAPLHISATRLYVTATNLYTLTKYSGPDPEVNVGAGDSRALVQGMDFGTPPQPISVSFGVNITL
jgi:TonB-linked outer membrane protein, SusC/RagA family